MRRRQGYKVSSRFRFSLEAKGLASNTIRNYMAMADKWLSWCEDNEVNHLEPSPDDIKAYFGELLRTYKPSYVELARTAIRIFYAWLIEEGDIPEPNPAAKIPLKHREIEPSEPFTRDELARMMMACQTHQERAVFLLLMGGGLRRSEIYGITRQDVNEEQGTIRVLGKGHQWRWIAPGETVIKATLGAMEFSDRLCPQAADDVVYRIARRIARRANIRGRFHPHRFRHSYATTFLDEGGGLEELQHILGHKRIEQTLYYARAGAKRRALKAQATINIADRMLRGMPRLLTAGE
jgi:site-specific recombinase XerD